MAFHILWVVVCPFYLSSSLFLRTMLSEKKRWGIKYFPQYIASIEVFCIGGLVDHYWQNIAKMQNWDDFW